jgi:hypothetical protein
MFQDFANWFIAIGISAAGRSRSMAEQDGRQLLHLVFGGELKSLQSGEFRDLDALDIVGIYPNYATALDAWRAKAQASVDNAHMRYYVVHLHRLLEPGGKAPDSAR